MLTDPIADMLSRIRNANRALHDHVEMPNSRIKQEIARLLKEEGYIRDYHVENGGSYKRLVIDLKYSRSRERVITNLSASPSPDAGSTLARTGCRACSAVWVSRSCPPRTA
jgi:small subunit ribosomal protein S8